MSGSRQPGAVCVHTNPVVVADGTTCLAPSPPPGPVGSRPPLTAVNHSFHSVAHMSHQEKMAEAIRRAHAAGLISREIMRQLPSVGELIFGIGVLIAFYTSTERATSYAELDQAGREFATGLAEVGVGTIMTILSVLGARQGLKMGRGTAGKLNAAESPSEPPVTPRIREEPPRARREPEPRRPASPNRNAIDVDREGIPIGARRGVANPGLPKETLSKEGWPDLPARQAPNFNSAEPVTLKPGTKIYRVIDDSSNPAGGYWTEKLPGSRAEWRSDLAVSSEFNANGKYVEYTVPEGPGLNVWRGATAAQPSPSSGFYYPGGGQQIWMPPNAVTPGVAKP